MNSFVESGYKFTFDPTWDIIRYDAHRFYLTLSGLSFSGVDFIGIHENTLYLIELKNFHQYGSPKHEKSLNTFCREIAEKLLDSIKLLRIIQKYHSRKILYRLFYPLVKFFPILNKEWSRWAKFYELSIGDHQLHYILYLKSEFDHDLVSTQVSNLINEPRIIFKVTEFTNEATLPHVQISKP